MKRYGGLWAQVVSWDNLLLAAKKAQRGKRGRPVVQRFNFAREYEMLRLQRELTSGAYQPGPFRTHWITRPKARLISAAPYRDRVVHHALMNVLEPLLERHFHPDSYACRRGKGTHAAIRRLQQLMRRNHFLVHCDVRKFFPSIDHALLKDVYRQRIKDRQVVRLLDVLVDGANPQEAVQEWFPGDDLWTPGERRRGLPIGNLTSQWLANWYLNDLDFLLSTRVGGLVRYCDDFILLDKDRERLGAALASAQTWLATRRVRLHPDRQAVIPVRVGVKFVGYRVWANRRTLPKANVRRFRRRLRWLRAAYGRWQIASGAIQQRLWSWLGHASQANTRRLVARLAHGMDFPP